MKAPALTCATGAETLSPARLGDHDLTYVLVKTILTATFGSRLQCLRNRQFLLPTTGHCVYTSNSIKTLLTLMILSQNVKL